MIAIGLPVSEIFLIESALWTHGQMNAQTPARVPSIGSRCESSAQVSYNNNYDLGMKSVYLVFCLRFPLHWMERVVI